MKRVYAASETADGARFLVDRLWPRGVSREALNMDAWIREVAPSDALRRWFQHDPAKWAEFQRRYSEELDSHPETLRPILEAAGLGSVTLLYAARDLERNNAIALKTYLEAKAKGHGPHSSKRAT